MLFRSGAEGFVQIQDSFPNLGLCTKDGFRSPDTTYWPQLHGQRAGALGRELAYFVGCIQQGQPPSVITPLESLEAVRACLAAEESAASGKVVDVT